MKMVKSLLLGSAAGMVAVAGAQAADLPVKAKPVEYVKICTLYGDGFYYIPGSDTCLKVSGYVRADYGWNVTGSRTPHYSGTGGAQDRSVSPYSTRHRIAIQLDSRTQTQYGTVRTFTQAYLQNEDGVDSTNISRGFIQWAGWTFGRIKSFSDPVGDMGDGGFRSLHQTQNQSDSGANGVNQIAYTWEVGNGGAFTIGADERRVRSVSNLSNNVWTIGSNLTTSAAGNKSPTPYAAYRVSQAWGSASISVVAQEVNAQYYGAAPGIAGYAPSGACIAQPATTNCAYPADKWGWAVLSGIEIKAPWISPGDRFGGYFNYGVGTPRYSGGSNLAGVGIFGGSNGALAGTNGTAALGAITDAVYVNGSGLELTTAWTVAGAYEHNWTSNFSTTVYGTYTEMSYNDTVKNNRWFCGSNGGSVQNVVVAAAATCDPSFHFWTVGSHTDWYPVAGLRLAVDVLYTQIDTAFAGQVVTLSKTQGARPTGTYTAKNLGVVSAIFRAQRTFPAAGGE